MTVDDFISVARKLEIIFLKKENIFYEHVKTMSYLHVKLYIFINVEHCTFFRPRPH